MLTGRSLTVCCSLLPRGVSVPGGCLLQGVSAPGGCLLPGGVCSRGCMLLGGVCFWGGVCSQGGVCSGGCLLLGRGVSALGGVWSGNGWGCLLPVGGVSQHALRQTPSPPPLPVDRILDTRFWKYYLGPTSLRPVMISGWFHGVILSNNHSMNIKKNYKPKTRIVHLH